MDYRSEALAKLDPASFLAALGIKPGALVGGKELRFSCPLHEDKNPSANINLETKEWFCHVCQVGGSPIDLLMRQGRSYRDALTEVGRIAGLEPPRLNGGEQLEIKVTKSKLTEANVRAWHEAALRNAELMRWFREKRGFTDETIARWQLGWDGQRVTIPIRDEHGKLVNVRRYLRGASGSAQKMLPLQVGAGPDVTTRPFPLPKALPPRVLLLEGEWDTILAHQYGFTEAMTITSGAGIWNPTFTPLFSGHEVVICYDNDEAGRRGAVRVAAILANAGARVKICWIPNLPEKGDITDFFVEQGRSADELRELIDTAAPYLVAPEAETEVEAVQVPLHAASSAAYRGVRQEIPVLLSGKAMMPYTVPYRFTVRCDMGNKRLCGICPLQEAGGTRQVILKASDPAVLSLIDVSASTQYQAIKELAQAVRQCNRPMVDIAESINVEELRLIPEIDSDVNVDGDSPYVTRVGYFLGHGLMPNRSYRMRGWTHPHPKTQATVHLFDEAEPSQDNIGSFVLTPEVAAQLEVFRAAPGQVAAKYEDIYDDFARNVHRIYDRLDMQIALDLAWHSVIAFMFNGSLVRRGWVETMIIGDSGQGKTEMTMALLRHYRLGERIQGEQASGAGVIGGLEKIGDHWILVWGRMPLNDKRVLIIDETQGLSERQIEAMSDVRATGVAEITKIRTERTNARCRLIWLANPRTGLTLAQHNQGVLAIREIFKKPEDIRRLDFAICVASGDVDFARSINVRHAAPREPRYSSDACRNLILWAWSRRHDQIEFQPDAVDAILAAATDMGKRYHPSIPLVEPSDQRLKLARLAAAAAVRVWSADSTGERLIVTREHVDFVVNYLERIYNSPSMAYGEFSEQAFRSEVLGDEAVAAVKQVITSWENASSAIEFFRAAKVFRKADLIDVVGWDPEYAKEQLRFLASNRLLKTYREGYIKTPSFIVILRQVADLPPELFDVEPDEDDVF